MDDLLGGMPRFTPVLHLHGKVGWYRRTDSGGLIYALDATQHDIGSGIPIVMLPDPQKTYEGNEVLSSLWEQLEVALGRARRVLVLGHSLGDELLVRTLLENITPQSRVAITVFGDGSGGVDPSAADVAEGIRVRLPGALIIPVRFGETPASASEGFESWLKQDIDRQSA